MKIFKITPKIEVVCTSESTRSGFRHLATLFIDGQEHSTDKCTYQNRTWESYDFQSVLHRIITRSDLTTEDKNVCLKFIEKGHHEGQPSDVDRMMNRVTGIANLAEVFCDTQKEKNNWKLRMLKAGLESKGLIVPEDWESLSEEQKQERLDAVIKLAGANQ